MLRKGASAEENISALTVWGKTIAEQLQREQKRLERAGSSTVSDATAITLSLTGGGSGSGSSGIEIQHGFISVPAQTWTPITFSTPFSGDYHYDVKAYVGNQEVKYSIQNVNNSGFEVWAPQAVTARFLCVRQF